MKRYLIFEVLLVAITLALLAFAVWYLLGYTPTHSKAETSTTFSFGDRDRGIINDADIEQRQQAIESAIVAATKAEAERREAERLEAERIRKEQLAAEEAAFIELQKESAYGLFEWQ
jgi:hypothetical protein